MFTGMTAIRSWRPSGNPCYRLICTLLICFLLSCSVHAADDRVNIDFNDVDIRVFVKYISEMAGKNFVIDNRVKGKITIVSPGPVTKKEAWQVFESVLETHGFAAVPSGEIMKIVTLPEARTKAVKTQVGKRIGTGRGEDRMITQLIPLQYADPKTLKRLFGPLVSKTSSILAYQASNMLIVTDIESNIRRLMEIVEHIDVRDMGREISVTPLVHADATKLVKTLETVFRQSRSKDAKNVTEEPVKFVADERTNSLILLASKVDIDRVSALVRMLDKEVPKGKERERVHVFYLEHAVAEDLAKVLQSITGKGGSSGSSQGKGKKDQPLVSKDVTVTSDKATNSLIILASKADYQVLEGVIKKLDVPRAMVMIECLIAEINVDNSFGLGMEWAVGDDMDINGAEAGVGGGFSGTGGTSSWSNTIGLVKNGVLPSGFSLGVAAAPLTLKAGDTEIAFPNLSALIQAYKSNKDVTILSEPKLSTLDNQEATLTVGKNIPYLIKSSTGDNAYNNYEYKDVGVTLKITPQVSKDGLIRLDLFQEITSLDSAAGNLNELPTTFKRNFDTTVLVRDGNTLVIGGLISNSMTNSEYKVPCLGDIPVVNLLFRSIGDSSEKTNLYVFITPRIIRTLEQAKHLTDEKVKTVQEFAPSVIPLYEGSPVPQEGVESGPVLMPEAPAATEAPEVLPSAPAGDEAEISGGKTDVPLAGETADTEAKESVLQDTDPASSGMEAEGGADA